MAVAVFMSLIMCLEAITFVTLYQWITLVDETLHVPWYREIPMNMTTYNLCRRWSAVAIIKGGYMYIVGQISRDYINNFLYIWHHLIFIKFNNLAIWHLNGFWYIISFCCTTQDILEPMHVYELSFSMDCVISYAYIAIVTATAGKFSKL